MFRFAEDYKQLCADTGSVKGASELACYSDFLWFDIDSSNLNEALVNARDLIANIEKLDATLSEQLAIYFSGSKGFHVGIPANLFGWEPSVDLPRIHKILAKDIAPDTPIDTAIYEHNRLWRIPNTKHGKSGLYKVPLTNDQLTTWCIDRITQYAARPTAEPALAIPGSRSIEPNDRLREMYEQIRDKIRLPRIAKRNQGALPMAVEELKKPCIKQLLEGVEAGQRNEAAVRLSAACKKAGYSLERTLESMSDWNRRNQPPMSEGELETACRSAWEGQYDYGCNDPMLSGLCDSSCKLKQPRSEDRSKRPKCDSFVTLCDGKLAEQVVGLSGSQFAIYDPNRDGCDGYDGSVQGMGGKVIPYPAEAIKRIKAVHFPSIVESYGSEVDLISDIDRFVRKYLAVSDFFHQILPYYVLFTWVYDRFPELPYLRAIGSYGTGKSRFLKTVGSICYKPIFCMGAASISSIFRLLDMFRGTLVLDESDFNNSDEAHLTVKMLNTGYQKDFPIWRSEALSSNKFEPISFDIYGPKIIATRQEFKDQALESRCLTEQMDGKVRPGIPVSFTDDAWEEALHIRNKLLMWRFRNYYSVKPPNQLLDLKIHPRLAQILYPLSSVIKDQAVLDQLHTFMTDQDSSLKEGKLDSVEGQVVRAILELRNESDDARLTARQIADKVNESIKNEKYHYSAARIGRIISKTLGLPRERTGGRRSILIGSPEGVKKLRYWCDQFGLDYE